MLSTKVPGALALLLPLLLTASGCATSTTETAQTPTATATASVDETTATTWQQVDAGSRLDPVYWAARDTVGVTTYGGSGCPMTPALLERRGPSEIHIQWKPPTNLPCNADLRSFTFEASLPVGIDTTQPITVSGAGDGTVSTAEPAILPVQN